MTADELIAHFNLSPHPEGGHYRQAWIDDGDGRPAGTCIYFLLKHGERSHWHKVDSTEIWHYYAGAPLILRTAPGDNGPVHEHRLGIDFTAGESPQAIVLPHHWQAAETTGDYTLVGCTVSPGFQFSGFTLAAPDFDISNTE